MPALLDLAARVVPRGPRRELMNADDTTTRVPARSGARIWHQLPASAASAGFYGAAGLATIIMGLILAVVFDKGLGSPVAIIIWPLAFALVGSVIALFIYVPISIATGMLALRHPVTWFVVPLVLVVVSIIVATVIALRTETRNAQDVMAMVIVIYGSALLFSAGFVVHSLALHVSRLGAWAAVAGWRFARRASS